LFYAILYLDKLITIYLRYNFRTTISVKGYEKDTKNDIREIIEIVKSIKIYKSSLIAKVTNFFKIGRANFIRLRAPSLEDLL
jgi:hypothetical protein